jgi:hypothetical protein
VFFSLKNLGILFFGEEIRKIKFEIGHHKIDHNKDA